MKNTILICFCLIYLGCKSQVKTQEYLIDNDGITVEKFDSTNKDGTRYTANNAIYKTGKVFTFSYYYEDKKGVKYLMSADELTKDSVDQWQFKTVDSKDSSSVSQIILTVMPDLKPLIDFIPDYNQTVIQYDFKLNDGSLGNNEMTGLIENEKNLWMHPPRTDFFKILEINPFPYIKAPYAVGNKWHWQLEFGEHWSDKRWLTWVGKNENKYDYEITNKLLLETKIGKIECYEVTGVANSKLGTTKLVAYFSKKYGFVKLNYINIDGSKTVIDIEKIEGK
jgi:hypothetical protein